ncbi:Alternative oxidase, mitochondrial [Pseudocercospora fuligena]|uniref:Alternative oxidase n=1 Tax=Pseudocercospora fuligena TaxID=685502 RepID=A0A8H6RU28_9PEZI|nr:Alternative oxidase, mitochondrial [Pseudocercospora fuligena]
MSCTRTFTPNAIFSKQSAAAAAKALRSFNGPTVSRQAFVGFQHQLTARNFSTSRPTQWKEFFPKPDAPAIKETAPAWPHPVYTEDQMKSVVVSHRNAKTWSDYMALGAIRTLRWGMDFATGYKKGEGQMTERKYMIRNIFLESVAGVPGMVAGMLRHLHSMRRMKRDNGWIETLLEESYNERMHLLTFLKMAEPGWFMRIMVLGAQGVFFNAFFVSYLISPRTCHRFVGLLEEEAVITYTREIADLDAGRLPMWEKMQAPDIAVKYWNMPEGHRTMRDLLLYIRADESKHREVNHTLGNLNQKEDPNPYVSEYKDPAKPHPCKDLTHQKPTGWERDEVINN